MLSFKKVDGEINNDMISGKDLEFYENEPPPDEEITEFMKEEIAHAPKDPAELIERLHEHHSPRPPIRAAISMPIGKAQTTTAPKPSAATTRRRINQTSKTTPTQWESISRTTSRSNFRKKWTNATAIVLKWKKNRKKAI